MRARFDRLLIPTAALAALCALGAGAKEAGWRVNITGSLPGVFYRVSDNPRVGDYVQFCPPFVVSAIPDAKPGEASCHGKVPLLKRVVAVEGDTVSVDDAGVAINGRRLANSTPRAWASDGAPLPSARGEYLLRRGEVWVAGEHPDSFDSRYYGPVSIATARVGL